MCVLDLVQLFCMGAKQMTLGSFDHLYRLKKAVWRNSYSRKLDNTLHVSYCIPLLPFHGFSWGESFLQGGSLGKHIHILWGADIQPVSGTPGTFQKHVPAGLGQGKNFTVFISFHPEPWGTLHFLCLLTSVQGLSFPYNSVLLAIYISLSMRK